MYLKRVHFASKCIFFTARLSAYFWKHVRSNHPSVLGTMWFPFISFFCVCAKFFSSLFTTHASHCLFLLSVNIYSFQFFFFSVVVSFIVLIRLEYLLSMSFVVVASVFFALKMVNMNNHVIIFFSLFFCNSRQIFFFRLANMFSFISLQNQL